MLEKLVDHYYDQLGVCSQFRIECIFVMQLLGMTPEEFSSQVLGVTRTRMYQLFAGISSGEKMVKLYRKKINDYLQED